MTIQKRMLKEEFTRFFESPTREGLRELIKNNLGEFPNLDFKKVWLPFSQMARHILAIANSGGGCIIIGVAENHDKSIEANGIDRLSDKATIINGIKKFIPDVLLEDIEIGDFSYDEEYPKLTNKKFQVVIIPSDSKRLPYISTTEGDNIKNNAIYTRRGTSSVEVNYSELQIIINKRLETGYSSQTEFDLITHIEQLKKLYEQTNKYHYQLTGSGELFKSIAVLSESVSAILGSEKQVPNPKYPEESVEDFIIRMIIKKKKKIEVLLGVGDL